MATRSRTNAIASNDAIELELEAMRKEDSSWHPCQVSLSSTGVGLIVDYGNTDSEDIIVTEEEALVRLRIRSVPLHGDDCVNIQEGQQVLATQKSQSKSLFFDAEVEKALRVRHSKKVHCRCTFIIKWLHPNLKGEILTVPSSSIMKLATKGINVHPTICAFLSTLKSSSCPSTPPSPTIAEDMDCEMDLHELLEKQIADISNFADFSNKIISDNIFVGIEVDNQGQIQCRAVAGSKVSKSHVQVPPDQNHSRRTTRSTKKPQVEMEVKDLPLPAPFNQEELSENRSPLNPLAARAALASVMSKIPRNLEFSSYHEEKLVDYNSSDNITSKHDVLQSMNGPKLYNSPNGNSFSMTNSSLQREATSVPFDSDPDKDVKSLISSSGASGKHQLVDASSGILTKKRESKNKSSEITDSGASFTCSVAKRRLSQTPKATRLTRSSIEKGSGIPDDTIERKTCAEEKKKESSNNTRRFTRSAVHKIKETQTMEAKQGTEEYILGKYDDSDSSDQNVAVLESYALNNGKSVTSRIDSAVELLYMKERYSLGKEEEGNKHEDGRKACAELRNPTSVRRLTRSAVQEKKGNKTMTATHGLEGDKLAQNTKSNSSEGNVTACRSNVLKKTEWTSSPLDADGDLPPTEERHDEGKMSSADKTTQKTKGNDESSRSLKRKCTSSKNQELRFSPRLRSLPQTRLQNNS